MSDVVSIHAAKTQLSQLVKRAAAGEPVYIGAFGRPQVKLVPAGQGEGSPAKRFGLLAGRLVLPEDLEEPLSDEVLGLFEGNDS